MNIKIYGKPLKMYMYRAVWFERLLLEVSVFFDQLGRFKKITTVDGYRDFFEMVSMKRANTGMEPTGDRPPIGQGPIILEVICRT